MFIAKFIVAIAFILAIVGSSIAVPPASIPAWMVARLGAKAAAAKVNVALAKGAGEKTVTRLAQQAVTKQIQSEVLKQFGKKAGTVALKKPVSKKLIATGVVGGTGLVGGAWALNNRGTNNQPPAVVAQ
ncbi:hypothetical protein BKA69DRAFT_1105406 [Paraphysoderma sedebokerense]|nr:hypothetical protein BKA69DRAFT_1105406 [Paraphysoderma sedebokerense]